MRILFSLLFFALIITAHAAPYTFLHQPPSGTWAAAGVSGGIPTNRTQSGATITATSGDRRATIQAAIDTAASGWTSGNVGKYVLLGAGTFDLSAALELKAGVTLRGSGMGVTILNFTGTGQQYAIAAQKDDAFSWSQPTTNNTVTSAQTAGTTTVTIGSTANFTAGTLIRFLTANQQNNAAITAGAVPVVKTDGGSNLRSQVALLSSKTSTDLTFSPGLYWDSTGLSMTVKYSDSSGSSSTIMESAGMEDFTLDCVNGTVQWGLYFGQAVGCWAYNVKVSKPTNYGIVYLSCFRSTIKKCYIDQVSTGGSNGSGILYGSGVNRGSSACLIEDNIIYKCTPSMEINYSSCGNTVAYNFCYDVTVGGTVGGGINTNHGPHNSFNLYEGNCSPNFEPDGYFGGASEDTVFRNWFTSVSAGASPRMPVLMKRLTWYYQVVGNLLGTNGQNVATYNLGYPNIGNDVSFTGNSNMTTGTFDPDWPTAAGTGGYQTLDGGVTSTGTFKGNYNTQDDAIPAGESLGTDTLPNSLYLASKPSWFYGLTYPAYDTSSLNFSEQAIPAGYRYFNGGANPPDASTVSSSMTGQIKLTGQAQIK